MVLIKNNLVLIFCSIIIILKIIIIDIDLPDWYLTFYQPIDELYYSYPAFNLYEFGNLFNQDPQQAFGNPILTNIFTYLSLLIFGDNYLGMRFPSLFFALISLFLFWKVIELITKNKLIINSITLFFALNFSFGLSSIVVEPTIARIFSLLISIYLVSKFYKKMLVNYKYIFIITTLITLLFLITYLTNAFIVLGVYLSIVIYPTLKTHKNKLEINTVNILKTTAIYTCAVITGFILYISVLYLLTDGNVINSILFKGTAHSDRVGINLKSIIIHILEIRFSNIFLFNYLFLFISMLLIFNLLTSFLFKIKNETVIALCFLISFIIQTIFLNDFPQRKLLILLPLILLSVIEVIDYINIDGIKKKLNAKKIVIYLAVLIFVCLSYYSRIGEGFYLSIIPLALFILLFVLRKHIYLKSDFYIVVTLFLLLIPEIYLTTNHLILNRTYEYKNSLKSLSKYENKKFIGGFSMGFRLYNEINSSLNYYQYYGKMDEFWKKTDSLSRNGEQDYSIGLNVFKEEYEKIGYEPIEIILEAEKTVFKEDLILFKEIVKK